MHTGHHEQSEQDIRGDGEGAETRDGNTDASIQDQPSIMQLQSAADEFQAAFNTALYELETSRRQAGERAARIDDLNESIVALNNALAEQAANTDSKSQAVDTLEKQLAAAESECATLTSKLNEQSRSQEEQLEQVNRLSAQVEELTGEINQHKSAGLQVAEEYARERSQLGSHIAKLKELYNDACYRLEEAQQEIGTSQAKLESGSETIAKLNAEIDGLRERFEKQSVAMASQNERFALQDSEISTLQGSVNELLGHREKIESLNRALHESSISENTLHQKIMEEKESMICALKERLSHGADESALAVSAESERLKAELDARDARLREQDSEIQALAGRAASAAELEARVRELSGELTEAKAEGAQQLVAADAVQSMQEKVDALAADLGQALTERDELAAQLSEYLRLDTPTVQNTESEQQTSQHSSVTETHVMEMAEPETAVNGPEVSVSLEQEEPEVKPEEAVSLELEEPVVMPEKAVFLEEEEPEVKPAESMPLELEEPVVMPEKAVFLEEEEPEVKPAESMPLELEEPEMKPAEFVSLELEEPEVKPAESVALDLDEPDATPGEPPAEELNFGDAVYVEPSGDVAVESSLTSMDQQCEDVVEVQSLDVVSHTDADTDTQVPGSESVPATEAGSDFELAPVDVQEETVTEDVSELESPANNTASVEVAMPGGENEFGDYIRDILECNRLRLYFQPIPALVADINNCFEVLARFVGPDERLVLPGEVFEKAGSAAMSGELDRRIVEAAIMKLAGSEISEMKLFVKLTRQSVTDHDFPVWVMGKLKEYGVKAGRLVFEVDEKTMEEELKNLSMLSRALSAMGCMVSIEHYRMQSAPECLDQIHVDYLKIDRRLVHEIGSDQEHLGTVKKIMELARSRGLLTVAEGVEKPEDLAKLWELGVSQAQGFFIYEPSGEPDMEMTGSEDENKEANGKATYMNG